MSVSTVMLHIAVAWTGVLAGLVSGTLIGMRFHREEWLGGYSARQEI